METTTKASPFFKVHTPCKKCCFATWEAAISDDGKPVDRQIGCKLGRVDAYRKVAGDEALIESYDDEKEFYVINGRLCTAYRDVDSPWVTTDEDLVEKVMKEVRLRLSVIVLVGDATEEGLIATAESLKSQKINPEEVFFVHYKSPMKPSRLNALLMRTLGSEVTWRIVRIVAEETTQGEVLDQVISQARGGYYGVFHAGFVVPDDFISELNSALNERLERFSLLRPLEDGNGLVVQTALHKSNQVGGNEPLDIFEKETELRVGRLDGIEAKVEYLAESFDQMYMLNDVEVICPCLKASL